RQTGCPHCGEFRAVPAHCFAQGCPFLDAAEVDPLVEARRKLAEEGPAQEKAAHHAADDRRGGTSAEEAGAVENPGAEGGGNGEAEGAEEGGQKVGRGHAASVRAASVWPRAGREGSSSP